MTPANHIVHYKGCTIIYDNGVYKIKELPVFDFLSMTEAKKEVDKVEVNDELFNLKLPDVDNQEIVF